MADDERTSTEVMEKDDPGLEESSSELTDLESQYDYPEMAEEDSPHAILDEGFGHKAEEEKKEGEEKESEAEGVKQEGKEQERQPVDLFTEDHITLAKTVGLTEEQARAFGTPEALETAIDRHLTELEANYRKQSEVGPTDKDKGEQKSEEDEFAVNLDPEEYDQAIIDQFKKLNEHWKSKYEALNGQVSDINQSFQLIAQNALQAQQAQSRSEFMEWVKSQGDEAVAMYGGGELSKMDKNSSEFKKCSELVETAIRFANVNEANGKAADMKEALNLAYFWLNRDSLEKRIKNETRDELKEKIKKHSGSVVPVPTQRRGPSESPKERAANAFVETLKNKGYSFDEPIEDDLDMFPK